MNIDILRSSIDNFIDQYACLTIVYDEVYLYISCTSNSGNTPYYVKDSFYSFKDFFSFIEKKREAYEKFSLQYLAFSLDINELINDYEVRNDKVFLIEIDYFKSDNDNEKDYKISYSYFNDASDISIKDVDNDVDLVRELDSIISKIQIEI